MRMETSSEQASEGDVREENVPIPQHRGMKLLKLQWKVET